MSFLPNIDSAEQMAYLESLVWRIFNSKEGIVLDTLDELRMILPADENWKGITSNEEHSRDISYGFVRYSRPENSHDGTSFYVAYGCNRCRKIIIGMPILKTDNNISDMHPLSGSESLRYYCKNCGEMMDEKTGRIS